MVAAGLLYRWRGRRGGLSRRAIDEDRLVVTPVRRLRRAGGIERLAVRVLVVERRPVLSGRSDRDAEPDGDDERMQR